MAELTIIFKPKSIMGEWVGMNWYANKELNLGFDIKQNEIWIVMGQSPLDEKCTIFHEKWEYHTMAKGVPYLIAHKGALKAEKNYRAMIS
jgi:hypothetical protein